MSNNVQHERMNQQLRYLSQPAFLEESVHLPLVTRAIVTIFLSLIALLTWSYFSKVNEVTVASGEVVPGEYIQLIQHLEGGIVASIDVKEGSIVKKGQVLVTLNGLDFKKDLKRIKLRQTNLRLQSERLSAFIKSIYPDFDKIVEGADELKTEQMDMFLSMNQSRRLAAEVIEKQIIQKEEIINNLRQKKKILSENIALTTQEYDIKKALNEKGMTSKIDFLKISQKLNDLKGRAQTISSNILQQQSSIAEFKNRMHSMHAQYMENAYKRLEEIKAQISQNAETIEKFTDKVQRLEIKSPANGLVKKLHVTTIGGIIIAGAPIMDILPVDKNVIVECKIKPSEIGHVRIGQTADVKVSSFDFSRYGGVTGVLNYISATTFENSDGKKYYLCRINLNQNYVGSSPTENVIMPGMTVQANIITGDKTILSYLLKPIKRSIDSALSEK